MESERHRSIWERLRLMVIEYTATPNDVAALSGIPLSARQTTSRSDLTFLSPSHFVFGIRQA
jgi:hypothetical protein